MYGTVEGRRSKGRKELEVHEMAVLVGAPTLVAGVVFVLFANAFHRAEGVILMLVFVGLTASAGSICKFRDDPFLMYVSVFTFIAWGLSAFVGLMSHDLAFSHYWFLHDSNSYANVLPAETAAGFADAGKISFADGTTLDVSKSLGYKDVNTYCVAPVVDELQSPLVQFWAVGMNCCEPRGGFECDDAWSPQARSGVVVPDTTGEYAAAIKMAEAAYNVASAEKYLLVRWVIDPETVEMNYWRVGVAVLLAGILVSVVVFGLATLGLNLALRGYASFFFR